MLLWPFKSQKVRMPFVVGLPLHNMRESQLMPQETDNIFNSYL